jgi:hypothetical protein
MMSVRNLCLFGSDWFGSKLLDSYHMQFNTLVIANSVMSGLIVPLVLLLPMVIVNTRDAQASNGDVELSAAPARAIRE